MGRALLWSILARRDLQQFLEFANQSDLRAIQANVDYELAVLFGELGR